MSTPRRNANSRHIILEERTFFVTASTWGKRALLQSDRSANLFIETLLEYRAQKKYVLHEFVVMPDHFHALITVGADMTIERAVQFIKGGFAFRAGRELRLSAPLWLKGFSENRVLDEQAYAAMKMYIWENPVKARLVERAPDYQYSTAARRSGLDPPPQRLKPPSFAVL
jgi:putative transposase